MKVREVIRVLEVDGWYQIAQRGSHRQFRHPTKAGRVTVAGNPGHEMARGTFGQHLASGRVVEGGAVSTWSVVYERTATGWSAYPPALPGVGVAGATREEAERLIAEAIVLHLEGLAEDGLPVPQPDVADVGFVEAALPR